MAKTDTVAEFELVAELPVAARTRTHVETVHDRVIDALLKSENEGGTIKLPTSDAEADRVKLRYAAFQRDRSAVTRVHDGAVFVQIKPRNVRASK